MPSPVQFAMRTSHTKLYYTPGKIALPVGASHRGRSPRRSYQSLQWKEKQCEVLAKIFNHAVVPDQDPTTLERATVSAQDLREKNQALQLSKQRVRSKLSEGKHRSVLGTQPCIQLLTQTNAKCSCQTT